jgi:hypothetical protein
VVGQQAMDVCVRGWQVVTVDCGDPLWEVLAAELGEHLGEPGHGLGGGVSSASEGRW